jgi:hypothetical protein
LHSGMPPVPRRSTPESWPPPPQEISLRVQHLPAVGQKTVVKIHHAEKTLQLFDVLRGWAKFDLGGVTCRGGRPCCEIVWQRTFKKVTATTHFFKIDGKTTGGQSVEKNSQMTEVCLPVRRTYTGVVHVCKHTFQTFCGAVHHSLKGLCSVREPKWRERLLKQAKWHDNRRFLDVCDCNRDLVITLDKIDFEKCCNHASHWKGLACLAKSTCPRLSPN